jgi:hypothetical protein
MTMSPNRRFTRSRLAISDTELRRQLTDLGRDAGSGARHQRALVHGLLDSPTSVDQRAAALFGRRDVLRLGGLTVAMGTVLAACAYDAGEPGQAGLPESLPEPPEVEVTDAVLLRTASSLEWVAIDVYEAAFALGVLDGAALDVAKRFQGDHRDHAAVFESATAELGSEPFTCANPKVMSALIDPILTRITKGRPASGGDPEVEASDDPLLDVLLLAHGLEALAGSTYQAVVGLLNSPALRQAAMAVGKIEARHAALLALSIPGGTYLPTGTPVADEAGADTTVADTIPLDVNAPETTAVADEQAVAEPRLIPSAIPSAFGTLGAQQLIVGRGDVNGVRLKVNLETPSLNSLMYDSYTCE